MSFRFRSWRSVLVTVARSIKQSAAIPATVGQALLHSPVTWCGSAGSFARFARCSKTRSCDFVRRSSDQTHCEANTDKQKPSDRETNSGDLSRDRPTEQHVPRRPALVRLTGEASARTPEARSENNPGDRRRSSGPLESRDTAAGAARCARRARGRLVDGWL